MRGESEGKGISREESVRVNWSGERMWIEGQMAWPQESGLFSCEQGIMTANTGLAVWSAMTEPFASWAEDL